MIVVDASVMVKWFKRKNEHYTGKARMLLKQHLNKQESIAVPKFAFIEVANALATKTNTKKVTIEKNLTSLYEMNLSIHPLTQNDLIESATSAKKYHTTVYDMLYAVIAKKHHTRLVTADENFVKKTRFTFTKHLKEIEN